MSTMRSLSRPSRAFAARIRRTDSSMRVHRNASGGDGVFKASEAASGTGGMSRHVCSGFDGAYRRFARRIHAR